MSEQDDAAEAPRPELPDLPEVDLWLVDGFNALHAVLLGGEDRDHFWRAAQRERLIERLAAGLAAGVGSGARLVVVFDGRRPVEGEAAHPAPGLELVFAPSADDWIVKRARRARAAAEDSPAAARERVGVVSNDRQVAGRCRHAGTPVWAPGAFLAHFPAQETHPDERSEPA